MKRWALLWSLLALALPACAQNGAIGGFCVMGGVSALTSGLPSTNKLLGIVPSCTVTVFLTGTTTKATIYSNTTGTPLTNPFTATNLASTAPGQWIFYVPTAGTQAYDIVLSGQSYVNPVTLTDVALSGGGSGSSPPQYSIQYATTNGAFGSDSCITINPTTHQIVVCGTGTGVVELCGATSGLCVSVTVPDATAAYSVYLPGAAPSSSSALNCLTAPYTSSSAVHSSWTGCDGGPFNPSNSTTYSSGPAPPTTIKAANFGTNVCTPSSADDWPAIQAALNSLARPVGILQAPPQPMQAATVELPQGRCQISQPLVAMNYGSLQGSGNGTWIAPTSSWSSPAGSALVNIAESYNTALYLNQSDTTVGRFVKGINFEYNGAVSAITAIKVYNQTGTATTPYPSGSTTNPQPYQIPNVKIEDINVYAMDTAIDLEDCGNCILSNVNAFGVRQGVVNGGNNYSLQWFGGNILDGLTTFTPTTGSTYGVVSQSEVRYSCTGGTGAACIGGTIAANVIVSPQTFQMSGVTLESFTYDAYIANCLNYIASSNGFDAGGTAGLYLGQLKFANVFDNFMATNTGDGIQLASVNAAQGAGLSNQDGVWIYANQVYSYQNSTGSGINLLSGGGSGSNGRRNVYIKDNQLTSWGKGINVQSPLTYSIIEGNYGNSITTALAAFPVTAAGSYAQTTFDHNTATSAVPCYTGTAGSGLVIGYNSCGNPTFGGQLTGTQTASGAGCSTGAGVGANCLATITIPNQYLDSSYSVNSCQIVGASGLATPGLVVITNGAQFGVYETSLSSGGVTGGTWYCTVNHQ